MQRYPFNLQIRHEFLQDEIAISITNMTYVKFYNVTFLHVTFYDNSISCQVLLVSGTPTVDDIAGEPLG